MKNKGITLITLVITIIVLLILAGLSITFLTGDNGILTKAKITKIASENSSDTENIILNTYESKINNYLSNDNYTIIYNTNGGNEIIPNQSKRKQYNSKFNFTN